MRHAICECLQTTCFVHIGHSAFTVKKIIIILVVVDVVVVVVIAIAIVVVSTIRTSSTIFM